MGARAIHISLLLKRGQGNMIKTIHSKEYCAVREWIVKKRKTKNITQRDLATMLKVQHSWVGKIETGERRLDIVEYCRICEALGLDAHDGLDVCLNALKSE